MFRFYNPQASSVRSLLIANCISATENVTSEPANAASKPSNVFEDNAKKQYNRTGNPPSHFNMPLERDLMRINSRGMRGTLQGAFQNWKPIDNVSDIGYTDEFHKKINQDLERERGSPCTSSSLSSPKSTVEENRLPSDSDATDSDNANPQSKSPTT